MELILRGGELSRCASHSFVRGYCFRAALFLALYFSRRRPFLFFNFFFRRLHRNICGWARLKNTRSSFRKANLYSSSSKNSSCRTYTSSYTRPQHRGNLIFSLSVQSTFFTLSINAWFILGFICSLISVFPFTLKGSCYIYRSRIHTGRIRGFTVFGRAGGRGRQWND